MLNPCTRCQQKGPFEGNFRGGSDSGIVKPHGGVIQNDCLHAEQVYRVFFFPQKLHIFLAPVGLGLHAEPLAGVNRRKAPKLSRPGQFNPALVAVPYGKFLDRRSRFGVSSF